MHALVKEYEDRRTAAKVPSSHVLKRSGVAPGTVWAWVNNDISPNLETLRRVNVALDEIISERSDERAKEPAAGAAESRRSTP